MDEEEFARQIQRLRGNNVTIEEMESRAAQFRTRLLSQPESPPIHTPPSLPYPIPSTGHLSRLSPGAPSLVGGFAANPRTPTIGVHFGPDAPESSQDSRTRGVSSSFGLHPDRLCFASANVNEIDPSLEKDDRTLEQKREDQTKAELLPPWERYRLYHPIPDYPFPSESWQNFLSKESLQGMPLTRTPTRDDSMLDSWKGEVRKRKRVEPSRPELDDPRGYPQTIVDCFGAYRPVSYFEDFGGLLDEQNPSNSSHEDILHQLRDSDSRPKSIEFEKAIMVSPWITKLTPESYDLVVSAFEKEEIQLPDEVNEVIVVEDTNKRRKIEEKESKPAGFRGTRFYRIMKATVKFLFSKNS